MNQKIQAVIPELLSATELKCPLTGNMRSKAEWITMAKQMESPTVSDAYMEYRWLTFLHSTLYPNTSTRFDNQLHNVVYNMLVEETA
jgi:hypothetical protein